MVAEEFTISHFYGLDTDYYRLDSSGPQLNTELLLEK